jgi:hypothetical protein
VLFETGQARGVVWRKMGFGLGKGAGEENGNEEKEKGTDY